MTEKGFHVISKRSVFYLDWCYESSQINYVYTSSEKQIYIISNN